MAVEAKHTDHMVSHRVESPTSVTSLVKQTGSEAASKGNGQEVKGKQIGSEEACKRNQREVKGNRQVWGCLREKDRKCTGVQGKQTGSAEVSKGNRQEVRRCLSELDRK